MAAIYRLRYFFDWGVSSSLWSANETARTAFGYPADPDIMPLSIQTRAEIERLCAWHDRALNWASPSDPGPWRQEECERFNAAALALLNRIRSDLGPAFDVINEYRELHEDPGLDRYEQGPQEYRRL